MAVHRLSWLMLSGGSICTPPIVRHETSVSRGCPSQSCLYDRSIHSMMAVTLCYPIPSAFFREPRSMQCFALPKLDGDCLVLVSVSGPRSRCPSTTSYMCYPCPLTALLRLYTFLNLSFSRCLRYHMFDTTEQIRVLTGSVMSFRTEKTEKTSGCLERARYRGE